MGHSLLRKWCSLSTRAKAAPGSFPAQLAHLVSPYQPGIFRLGGRDHPHGWGWGQGRGENWLLPVRDCLYRISIQGNSGCHSWKPLPVAQKISGLWLKPPLPTWINANLGVRSRGWQCLLLSGLALIRRRLQIKWDCMALITHSQEPVRLGPKGSSSPSRPMKPFHYTEKVNCTASWHQLQYLLKLLSSRRAKKLPGEEGTWLFRPEAKVTPFNLAFAKE